MKMKDGATFGLVAAVLSAAVASSAQAAAFTPGNIVVTRAVGGAIADGSTPGTVAPLTTSAPIVGNGVAATVEIDEYTPAGALVQSFDLPNVQQTDTTAGNSYALTFSDGQNQEGTIEVSGDGKYFSLVGYNQTPGLTAGAPGNAGTNAAASATVQRVVGIIGMDGTYNTTTGLTDVANTVSVRSAYTSDGTNIWVNGAAKNTNAYSGVHYTTVGSTTSTIISAVDNSGGTNIVGGFNFGSGLQLLASSTKSASQANPPTSAAFRGVATVGTGLPTDGTNLVTPLQLPGFDATTTPPTGEKADNFWFKDANTLYVADDGNTATGGVQKWSNIGGTWTFQYNVTLPTGTAGNAVGAHGLSGSVDAQGNTDLFATSFDSGLVTNDLYSIVDPAIPNATPSFNTPTHLATSDTNSAFRGVAVVPMLALLDGDANGDNKVDLNDLNTVLNHLGVTSSLRSDGNFDGAATIDLNDLNDVLNHLGTSQGGSASALVAATPEPASLGLLGLGIAGMFLRRRRA